MRVPWFKTSELLNNELVERDFQSINPAPLLLHSGIPACREEKSLQKYRNGQPQLSCASMRRGRGPPGWQ